MKKTICILLCILLFLNLFSICAAAQKKDDVLRIIVTSDVHWQNVGEVHSDGFYRPRDSLGQMTALTPLITAKFLEDAAASDAEYVFITGDLTNTGSPDDSRDFAAILSDFEDKTGKKVFVIDGNHDVDLKDQYEKNETDAKLFKKIYARFGYDEAIEVDKKTCSYTADLNNGYRLLAIDSNRWNGHGDGFISEELMLWIGEQVEAAKQDGKHLIAMMHHHLMEHYTMESKVDDFYIVKNFKDVCKRFDEWNIRLTFTGHLHMGDVAAYKGENLIYDATTASLSCYPLTYRYVEIADENITMESRTIDSLAVADIVKGYSEKQKKMIAADPVGYAYGCMQDSFLEEYVVDYMDPDRLIDMTGAGEDSILAKVLRIVLPDMNMHFYGNGNTVEQKAEALGFTLTRSEYKTIADLITEYWASFTRGDEDFGGNSTEGKLVLETLYAVIASNVGDEYSVAKRILSCKVVSVMGLKLIDNFLTRAALDVLLIGLFVDKAPADNDVTLPGYGVANTGFYYRFSQFLKRLFTK